MAKVRTRITWNAWGDTHPGKIRENNEDRIHCDPERGIFIVVDGMGGQAAGEIAAQNALDCIRQRLDQETGTVARRIHEAIASANNEVYRLAQSNSDWEGMACVLTVAVIENELLHVGHVGDSRLYLVRDHRIRKVTPDHSPVGRREDRGELSELEAMRHPRRNEVFRDVGSQAHKPDDDDFIEYLQLQFERDSALVLCSDGLSDMLTSSEILHIIEQDAGNARQAVRDLIAGANAAGGRDNVSAIVVEGNDFGGVASSLQAEPEDPRPVALPRDYGTSRTRRWLGGRWQIFLYGVICGALAIAYLQYRKSRIGLEPEDEALSTSVERHTLIVGPTAPELKTIVQALEKARPGDRVSVAAGEYPDPIRLKDGIAIAAQSPGEVIIHVSNPLALDDAAVVADGVRGAELSGVVIKAGPEKAFPFGIRIFNADVKITNTEVTGAANAGVWIGGNSHATVAASYIYSNAGAGIIVAGTARPRLVGNVIQANGGGIPRPGPGILVTDNAEPVVQRNVITGNAAEGIRVRQPHLKDRMAGNLFNAGGKPNKAGAVSVEKVGDR